MLAEKQRIRAVNDRRTHLINELYKLGYKGNGKPVETMNLAELEQIHINERCRAAQAYSERG